MQIECFSFGGTINETYNNTDIIKKLNRQLNCIDMYSVPFGGKSGGSLIAKSINILLHDIHANAEYIKS